MKRLLLCMIVIVSALTETRADYLKVYNGSNFALTAQTDLGSSVAVMTKETGNLAGTGQQGVVLHDGTNLKAYAMSGGTLVNFASRASEVPNLIATGGDMNNDGKDDVIWFSSAATSNTCRAYSATPTETGMILSVLGMRSNMVGPYQIGMGNTYTSASAYTTGNEFNGYDNYGTGYFVSLYESALGFTAGTYFNKNIGSADKNINLIDMQHINVASRGDGLENLMVSFYNGSLAVWHYKATGQAGCYYSDADITINPGQANEALFLQTGNVSAYSKVGPEEMVLYREDGSVFAYSIEDSANFSTQASGNIGIGVTDMLLGNVIGDALEELVVAKGNTVEVYSLASGAPQLLSTGTIAGLYDLSLGDMDGDGYSNIIAVTSIPEPLTLSLMISGMFILYRRKK